MVPDSVRLGPGSVCENAANAAVVVIAFEVETDRRVCDVEGVAAGAGGMASATVAAGREIGMVARSTGNAAVVVIAFVGDRDRLRYVETVAGSEQERS